MRILGLDLPREPAAAESTLVLLDDRGHLAKVQRATSLPELVGAVAQLALGEPFLLGVDVPIVVPGKQARTRPVESLLRRRFGFRLPPGGRTAPRGGGRQGVAGEVLIAGLAAAGHPCLPYPDRDGRQSCLAETHPALNLKAWLWQVSPLAAAVEPTRRDELFRAYAAPSYRSSQLRVGAGWAEHAAALDLVLRALEPVADLDCQPVRQALNKAATKEDVERAGALLDALLIAGTARRYTETPEACLFLGDRDGGYVILPADGFVRRLATSDTRTQGGRLFPRSSLRQRLGPHAQLRSTELVHLPGRPQRIEASFEDPPSYEFDNLDEMLWWKHCRHVAGASLPTEGLRELVVLLPARAEPGDGAPSALSLVRSRHRTLSFRFEPPVAWRNHVPTRDGKTYLFRVLRATYETLQSQE